MVPGLLSLSNGTELHHLVTGSVLVSDTPLQETHLHIKHEAATPITPTTSPTPDTPTGPRKGR